MNYEDLRIYQLAKKLREELQQELAKIPHYWRIREVDQAVRSSCSATSNIVEGHGRRFHPRDFCRFLVIAMASSDETQDHLIALQIRHYLSKEKSDYFIKKFRTLSIQILNFINCLRKRYRL